MGKYRYWGMIGLLGAGLALTLVGCGGGGSGGHSSVGNDSSYRTSSANVTTLVGTGGTGFVDGSGTTEPTFNGPTGIALGTVGDSTYLYVADTGNKAIRRIDLLSLDVLTIVKNGTIVGTTTLSLSSPKDIACDNNSYFYVSDGSTIYKINSTRTSLETLNSGSSNVTGIVYYDSTTFYIADYGLHVICSVNTSGTRAVVAGSEGVSGATNTTDGTFTNPYGVTTDGTYLYVADCGNSTIRKVVISGADAGKVTTLAGLADTPGTKDGKGTTARFNHPTGITYYSGALYVADTNNHIIRKVVIPALDPSDPDAETAEVTTVAGYKGYAGFSDGTTGNAAKFRSPTGIVSDGSGNLYVADKGNNRIRKIEL
jgi:sugar lactone lactonase YvrE